MYFFYLFDNIMEFEQADGSPFGRIDVEFRFGGKVAITLMHVVLTFHPTNSNSLTCLVFVGNGSLSIRRPLYIKNSVSGLAILKNCR